MRAWKFVAILAVMVSVLSLYQLSFTFKANAEDKKAENFAQQRVADALILNPNVNQDSVFKAEQKSFIAGRWEEKVYMGFSLKKVKQYALNLGLDLQGGTHVTVIVAPDDILKRMSGNSQDEAFNLAIANAKARISTTQAKFTEIFIEEWQKVSNGKALNEIFLSSDNSEITLETSDDDIIDMINKELDLALERSVTVLRSRIDEFGATNPIIHPVKSTGRIEIELPGFDNEDKIRTQIERVAKLEFVQPYDPSKIGAVHEVLSSYFLEKEKTVEEEVLVEETDTVEEAGSEEVAVEEDTTLGLDVDESLASADTMNETSFSKIFLPSGGDFYIVRTGDYDLAKAMLASKEVQKLLPGDLTFMFNRQNTYDLQDGTKAYGLHFMTKGIEADVLLEGSHVSEAYVTRGGAGELAVGIQFDPEGGSKWAQITEEFKDRQIAIVLDDEVFSIPVIQEKMNTGSCIITGSFDYTEAKELANILKAGKLPAPTVIERLVTVGPSLGAEAIQQGLYSLLAGLSLVILFMAFYYNKGGIVSIVALFFNIFFIIGVLATPSFGVTLTLAGIAGIVLTIGMSIDANVLIFERIREELASGKKPEAAIEGGYSSAFWTIFDANITTFLSALVLYIFGTGLVQGFAVTLMIGVVCSFFAAVFITRLIIFLMGRNNGYSNIKFSNPFSEKLFKGEIIDFIGKRKFAYIFSAIVIVIGTGLIAKDGLNLGVAFKGGYSYVYEFDQEISAGDVRSSIKDIVKEADVQVKTYDKDNQLVITTSYMIESPEEGKAGIVRKAIEQGLSPFGNYNQLMSSEVGATIADDIKKTSIESVLIALVAIFLYIVFRFKKWQFGLGSLVALLHDVFFVLSVFAIARVLGFAFEIEEVFVAAILTMVGYSINDTVVVFDRIRENLEGTTSGDLKKLFNISLNDTLSRTIVTSVTTLLVVLVLFIFGGEALRGFSFALLIGVVIGTYSSLLIATPIVFDSILKSLEKEKK